MSVTTNTPANIDEILKMFNDLPLNMDESQKNGLILKGIDLSYIVGQLTLSINNAVKIIPVKNSSGNLEVVVMLGKLNMNGDDLIGPGGGNENGNTLVRKGQ